MASNPSAQKVKFDTPPVFSREQDGGMTAAGQGDGDAETKAFWATAPSLHQLSADPAFFSSTTLQLSSRVTTSGPSANAAALLPPPDASRRQYIDVDGPIDPEETLIRYDIPLAPKDPRRSLRLRKKLGLTTGSVWASSTLAGSRGAGVPETCVGAKEVDPNVRVVLDSFLLPRRWVDRETGVEWVQHAWPFPSSRTETMETQRRLKAKLTELGAKRTGTCPIRTVLIAECFLEVLRQVVAECWERGLLMLQIHAERVASQAAHRELFESRVGHAMRLALKGEKDATHAEESIASLQAKVQALEQEEQELKTRCAEFASFAEEQVLIEEKRHNDALGVLKKEGLLKRNQLEQMLAVPPPP